MTQNRTILRDALGLYLPGRTHATDPADVYRPGNCTGIDAANRMDAKGLKAGDTVDVLAIERSGAVRIRTTGGEVRVWADTERRARTGKHGAWPEGDPVRLHLTRDFLVNPHHGYDVAAGTQVLSAMFGRTQVDLWHDARPVRIWRGDPKTVVAELDEPTWTYVVHGVMSGISATEVVARHEAERRAWQSQANFELRPTGLFRNQATLAQIGADRAILAERNRMCMERFPADFDPWAESASPAP